MSHSVIYNKIFGSDIFNVTQVPQPPQKPIRPSLLRDSSDIFNVKSKKEKLSRIRNHSQSDIFFTDGKEPISYNSFHQKKEYKSDYNPDKYLISNTSYSAKMKEMYDINRSDSNIKSSKGYLEFMEVEQNLPEKPKQKKDVIKPYNKRKVNLYVQNRNFSALCKPREQYVTDQTSNIFNDLNQEKKNRVIKPLQIPKEKTTTYDLTQPKVIKHKNKWIANLNWKNPKGELIFKHYNDDSSAEKTSAFQRKMHDLNDSAFEYSDIHPKTERKEKIRNYNRINDYEKPNVPLGLPTAREEKVKENISNLYSSETFFEDNIKLKNVPNSSFVEKSYIVNNANNLEKKDLVKIFTQKGIHVYQVKENEDHIFNLSNKKKSYVFKVRETQSVDKKQDFEKASKELKDKYKNIEIVPENKICVNKRIHPDTYDGTRDVYKYNINNKDHQKPKTVKKNNDINRTFTNQYRNVNYGYKSNLLHKKNNL